MVEALKKKVGRPAKALGKRQSYAFRMNEPVRAVVAAAAEANGRSLSEEIERRVELSLERLTVVQEDGQNRADDERLRLECLKLAAAMYKNDLSAILAAEKMARFVATGHVPAGLFDNDKPAHPALEMAAYNA